MNREEWERRIVANYLEQVISESGAASAEDLDRARQLARDTYAAHNDDDDCDDPCDEYHE